MWFTPDRKMRCPANAREGKRQKLPINDFLDEDLVGFRAHRTPLTCAACKFEERPISEKLASQNERDECTSPVKVTAARGGGNILYRKIEQHGSRFV